MAEPTGADRRRYKRRTIHFPVRYRLKVEGVIREWNETEAGNISAGGILMTFGEELKQGQEIELDFAVPGKGRAIRAKGVIKWIKTMVPNAMVECGIEFADINPEDKSYLELYANEE